MTGTLPPTAPEAGLPGFDTFRHLEDFLPGEVFHLGEIPFDRDGIVAFAADFDPQPFHLDEEAGRRSLLGALAASGWHVIAALNGLLARALLEHSTATAVLSVPEVKWLRPVTPGACLSVVAEVASVAPPGDGGGDGVVVFRLVAHADDKAAAEMTVAVAVAPFDPESG